MKLSAYAKKLGITYRTTWTMFKQGDMKAYQLPSGTIIVEDEEKNVSLSNKNKVVIYARVSTNKQKKDLEKQAERLVEYSVARGYQIYKVIKEIASGLNDNRKKLNSILKDDKYSILLVEHKDRLTRFGFNYLEILAKEQKKIIEVVNLPINDKEDLVQDLVSIITSFCAKIYSNRKKTRKTEKIIEMLKNEIS